MTDLTIAVIGGDKRQVYMAEIFSDKGFQVVTWGLCTDGENSRRKSVPLNNKGNQKNNKNLILTAGTLADAVSASEIIVGGIPLAKEGKLQCMEAFPAPEMEELSGNLKEKQMVFGGMIQEEFKLRCKEKKVDCYDFMKAEPVAVLNAVATAEGAVWEAMKSRDTNIHGSESLVIGFGRCGKILGHKLCGLSAHVTVCSRCETERMYARAFGMRTIAFEQLEQELPRFEYIYNTVPAVILDKSRLRRVYKDSVIVDIASDVGGVDYKEAQRLGITALHRLGIPGKYAPKASADILVDYCLQKILPVLP